MGKSALEVQEQIDALPAFKKQVAHFDRYRVDQWKMIDAQVETLSRGLTLAQIKKRWNVDEEGDCRGAAEDALYWKQGGKVFSPVECWRMAARLYPYLAKRPKTRASRKALAPNLDFATVNGETCVEN